MQYNSLVDLVERLEKHGYIKSKRVKEAMLAVDRKHFVLKAQQKYAYYDEPLPILHNQTISAPHMVAIMLELGTIEKSSKILEVGTGSGYNACLLAYLALNGLVITIESIKELHAFALQNIQKCPHAHNIIAVLGDGSIGYPKFAPYDIIMVTCAVPAIPSVLIEQLSNNGKLIIPVGNISWQQLYLIEKSKNRVKKTKVGTVAFVPMFGKYGFK